MNSASDNVKRTFFLFLTWQRLWKPSRASVMYGEVSRHNHNLILRARRTRRGRRRPVNNKKIFLRDKVPVSKEPEFISPWSGKIERWNIQSEVIDFKPVLDMNGRQRRFPDKLIFIQIHKLQFKLVPSFRIGQAKIYAHLMVLTGEIGRPQVCKSPNEAFLPGLTVDNNRVAHKKRLDAGLQDFRHGHPITARNSFLRTCLLMRP